MTDKQPKQPSDNAHQPHQGQPQNPRPPQAQQGQNPGHQQGQNPGQAPGGKQDFGTQPKERDPKAKPDAENQFGQRQDGGREQQHGGGQHNPRPDRQS